MNNKYLRFDFYLSYWLLCWAILYILSSWLYRKKDSLYIHFFIQNCNPFIIFVIALIINMYIAIMIFVKVKPTILFLFLLLIIVIKIIPIYILYKEPIRIIPNIVTIIIFVSIYELYLQANGLNIIEFYKKHYQNLIDGNTPIIHFILSLNDYRIIVNH